MIRSFQRLGDGGEMPLADLDIDRRIREQVQRPVCLAAGRDQDAAVRLVDVADRDGTREPAPPSASRDACDLPLEEQVAADVVRRQRARCQDFPSVWVDGA